MCLNDEVASLYIDGELKEPYLSQYKAHIATCPFCTKKLQKLQALHSIFQKDKEALDLSKKDMQDDYVTLLFQLRYRKNTIQKKSPYFEVLKYLAVAAAVAFFVPFSLQVFKKPSPLSPLITSSSNSLSQPLSYSPVMSEANNMKVNFQNTDNTFALHHIRPSIHSSKMPSELPPVQIQQIQQIKPSAPYSDFATEDVSLTLFFDISIAPNKDNQTKKIVIPVSVAFGQDEAEDQEDITTDMIMKNIHDNITNADFFRPQFAQQQYLQE